MLKWLKRPQVGFPFIPEDYLTITKSVHSMECCVFRHFIWIVTDCKSSSLGVSCIEKAYQFLVKNIHTSIKHCTQEAIKAVSEFRLCVYVEREREREREREGDF